jgi:catechol 2,3-dioxygenase-like lactoylglutathione lyase family enzyme
VSTTKTRLDRISLVALESADQDRSIDFYVNKLGFEKRTDLAFGGNYRWVEVYPPHGLAGIALAPPREGNELTPKETGITLATDDIDAAHAELKAAGVDIDPEIQRFGDPVPPLVRFRDPDGHELIIVEQR